MLASIEWRHPEWKQRSLDFAASWCTCLADLYASPFCRGGTIDWDHLPSGPGDDHLNRDRLHHFAFAPLLARASLYGAPTEDELLEVLLAWIRSTERAKRPDGYSGSLIVVYRIVALSWAHALLVCKRSHAVLEFEILRVLLTDIGFVTRRLGTSFPNNHLLADGFVVWLAGMLYPEFTGASSWVARGEPIWLRELDRQIYADGTSFEHASHYHTMACEMGTSYAILNKLNRRAYPEWVDARVRAMLRVHGDLCGVQGMPFEYGDGVEDPLIPLGDLQRWGRPDYSGLLAAIFDEETRSAAGDDEDESAFWLAGGNLPSSAAEEERTPLRCYPQGGLYLFEDVKARTRLLFRTGPVEGLPVNPGHMHADVLSIHVHVDDVPMIVDAGTYTYRSGHAGWPPEGPGWRQYFMSAVAHNGLAIDGADPLERGPGDFPGNPIHSHATIIAALPGKSMAWVEAENRGNTAYGGHRRGVVQVGGRYHLIYDVLRAASSPPEAVSFGLQFDAGTKLQHAHDSGLALARLRDATLSVATTESLFIDTVASGQVRPPLGWRSERYGDLRPAPMLRYRIRGNEGPFGMVLSGGSTDAPASAVDGLALRMGARAFRVTTDRFVDYVMVASGDDAGENVAWDIHFVGQVLWLRTSEGRPRELRWLGGRSVAWHAHGLNVRSTETVGELAVQAWPNARAMTQGLSDQVSAMWFGEPLS